MTTLHQCAIRDAELTYAEADWWGPREWLDYVGRVRRGQEVGPAADALAEIGREALCRAWGVDLHLWPVQSGGWFREYDGIFTSAIEVLVRRTQEGR